MKSLDFSPDRLVYVANGDGTITACDEQGNILTFHCEAPDIAPRPIEQENKP